MTKTVTRNELANAVHQQIGLSHNESAQLVASVLEEVSRSLEQGDSVKLSSFGTFSVVHFQSIQRMSVLAGILKRALKRVLAPAVFCHLGRLI